MCGIYIFLKKFTMSLDILGPILPSSSWIDGISFPLCRDQRMLRPIICEGGRVRSLYMTKHVTLLNSDGHVRTRAHAARSSRTPLPGRRYTRLFCFFHARVSWLVRTVHRTPGLSDSICIQHMYVKCGKLEIHLFYSPLGPLCYCVREWT